MDFSLVSSVFETLRIAPPSKLILLEAGTLAEAHVPPYPPDMPILFTKVNTEEIASQLKKILLTTYPKNHEVFLVQKARSKAMQLEEMDAKEISSGACLYVPPLGEGTSFECFAEIVAHLRAPNGCPWDRE